MSDIVIGIDLGTTNSCVCVYRNGKLKLLEDNEGCRVTPSFTYFNDDGIVVGQCAKQMANMLPEKGIYEVKRLIGRKYNDPYVQKNLRYLSFKVQQGKSNQPKILIPFKEKIIKRTPQEICTLILKQLKTNAEAKLGHPVDKAVITVPAYFNMTQREVTLNASHQAGFTVLKLLNEPTAAALSYYYESTLSKDKKFSLVYDLGGGTFDVAILSCKGSDIDIIGVDGDPHLGGHDFDNLLVEHISQIVLHKYNFSFKSDRRNLRRLNTQCEDVKKTLSNAANTKIILYYPPEITMVEIPITRAQFENMANDLFRQTITIVDRCLKQNNMTKKDINKVILSGGSTRIPKIQSMIQEYFEGKQLTKVVNPDECVAEGAAIQAALLSKNKSQIIKHINITDVTPLSLGIGDSVGMMNVEIERNTSIPFSTTFNWCTVYNKQESITFTVYEGERLQVEKNYLLGVLKITHLTPAPPGQCEVSVTMSVDQNGILTVSATETVSNNTKEATFTYTRGSKSDDEVKQALVDAAENQKEDERFREFAENKRYFMDYCIRVRLNLEEKSLTSTYKTVYDQCYEALNLLKKWTVKDEKEMMKMKTEIVDLCKPIVRRYNFKYMSF